MALTLVATPGAPNANSYATAADADAYFEGQAQQGQWLAVDGGGDRVRSEGDRERYLVAATRLLDQHVTWQGYAASQTQALAWPRQGMIDPITLASIPNDAVHQWIRNATAEFAEQLAAENRTADNDLVVNDLLAMDTGVKYAFGPGKFTQVIPDAVFYWLDPAWYAGIAERRGFGQSFQNYGLVVDF